MKGHEYALIIGVALIVFSAILNLLSASVMGALFYIMCGTFPIGAALVFVGVVQTLRDKPEQVKQ